MLPMMRASRSLPQPRSPARSHSSCVTRESTRCRCATPCRPLGDCRRGLAARLDAGLNCGPRRPGATGRLHQAAGAAGLRRRLRRLRQEERNQGADRRLLTDSADIEFVPGVLVEVDLDHARKLYRLIDALKDNNDVQNIYGNFDVPADVVAILDEE